MANLKIKNEFQRNTQTIKAIELLNESEDFKKELEEVYIKIYHNSREDKETPEYRELINKTLEELEPNEEKRDFIYLESIINSNFKDWLHSGVMFPLYVEELENVFINKVYYPKVNKCDSFINYYMQVMDDNYRVLKTRINKVVTLYNSDFESLLHNLLNSYNFLTEGGTWSHYNNIPKEYIDDNGNFNHKAYNDDAFMKAWQNESFSLAQLIRDEEGRCIIVDTQGYKYARYVGFIDNIKVFNGIDTIVSPLTDAFLNKRNRRLAEEKEEYLNAMHRAYCD